MQSDWASKADSWLSQQIQALVVEQCLYSDRLMFQTPSKDIQTFPFDGKTNISGFKR